MFFVVKSVAVADDKLALSFFFSILSFRVSRDVQNARLLKDEATEEKGDRARMVWIRFNQ